VAGAGLAFLIPAALYTTQPTYVLIALGVFVVAAAGGFAMFLLYHLRQRPLPIAFMLGHGAAALVAYVLLLIALF
jgi:hypothetical protein